MNDLTRRHLLGAAGATIATGAVPRGASGATQSVNAKIYPVAQPAITGPYPEQSIPRFSAAQGQWGVSFSGGGSRAFTAAVGQMRGLLAAGVVDKIGAMSCVSGGAWFGATYTFAPAAFSDTTLLGTVAQPGSITVDGLKDAPAAYLGTRMTTLTNDLIGQFGVKEGFEAAFGLFPFDRIYSRIINDVLLAPYGIGGTKSLVAQNAAMLAAIRNRNPGLSNPFNLPRSGRPFLIINGTQIYVPGQVKQTPVQQVGLAGQTYRNIEYTPWYVGAPQLVPQAGGGGLYGGGYVETFAFDTPAPKIAGNIATVPQGKYPFLLSDMMGSSSAVIASYVQALLPPKISKFDPFPSFSYWPVPPHATSPRATQYDFGDGGILENTGVVSLLRRGYKTIFAFVNSLFPIGSTDGHCVDGIDGQISRLFGQVPAKTGGNAQSTRVFASDQFQAVVTGLTNARAAGTAPVCATTLDVVSDNAFGIAPYRVKIFWIYNDVNEAWKSKLPLSVKALFLDPLNKLENFPNYNLVFQNHDQILYLTPIQANLLAHMWGYTVYTGFQTPGSAFGVPIN